MSEESRVGEEVHHLVHGRGTVTDSRFRGFQLKVKFDRGQPRWVRPNQLEFTKQKSRRPSPVADKPAVVATPRLKYRRMVEAFKLGIVPDQAVREFTFGRSPEISFTNDWLEDPDRNVLLLVGEYGSGKTHLLEYIRWMALDAGYACAMVELHANESPLHKPKRVYRRLIKDFRYKNGRGEEARGFRDFISELSKNDTNLDGHRFLGPVLRSARTSGVPDGMWEWIEGHASWRRPKLYDYATCANLYCYVLSALGKGATELGLKGLLLLFDEAETLDVAASGYQIDKSVNFLRGLAMTCESAPELDETARQEPWRQGYYGAESRLQYGGYNPDIPYVWERPSHLKSIFSFVPGPAIEGGYLAEVEPLDLSDLDESARREVFEHMCHVYKGAHDYVPDQKILERTFRLLADGLDDSIRLFMKTTIETMDIRRLISIDRIQKPERDG